MITPLKNYKLRNMPSLRLINPVIIMWTGSPSPVTALVVDTNNSETSFWVSWTKDGRALMDPARGESNMDLVEIEENT